MSALFESSRIAAIAAGDDRYAVYNALEIVRIFRGLIAKRALVTVHASEGSSSFVTAVLEVDEDDETIVCDYGVDAALTERLLNAPDLTFVTQLDHVRVQFTAGDATVESYEGGPAFRIPIPEVLTRLQRREHYRLKVPRGRPLLCQFTPVASGDTPMAERRIALPVYDISCGGIALVGWPEDFVPYAGQDLPGASIVLPDLGDLVADLRVVHVEGKTGSGPNAGRFGCRFAKATPSATLLVQRYINRIERELRALM